jgi:hypothetical protein
MEKLEVSGQLHDPAALPSEREPRGTDRSGCQFHGSQTRSLATVPTQKRQFNPFMRK